MIDLFSLYQDFQSLVNTWQGGHFRPNTDFERAVNNISLELWEMWTREAEKSQEIKDNLIPFFKSANVITAKEKFDALVKYPDDYERFASARIMLVGENCCVPCKEINDGKCSNGNFKTPEELAEDYYNSVVEKDVDMIDNQRWPSVLKHKTKCPTFENPKITQINGSIKVAPRDVSVVVLNYYVKPVYATFKYKTAPGNVQTGAGDQIIYDPPPTSTPLQWSETVKNEFLWRLGERFGLFTKDQFMSQFSTQQKLTT